MCADEAWNAADTETGLGRWVAGDRAFKPIADVEAEKLTAAMAGLIALVAHEDKFAVVIDNLIELEMGLLRRSVSDVLRPLEGYDDLFDSKREMNRYLANLLSACRLYVDQTCRNIEPLLKGTELSARKRFSEEYDGALAYRVMETLRNYVQHRDFAVHNFTVGGGWTTDDPETTGLRYVVGISLDLEHLADAGDIKPSVLAELNALPHVPDLKLLAREYVAALARVHKDIRKALQADADRWQALVKGTIESFENDYAVNAESSLCILLRHASGQRRKIVDVHTGPIERLQRMQRLNFCPTNLTKAFVSSEAPAKKR